VELLPVLYGWATNVPASRTGRAHPHYSGHTYQTSISAMVPKGRYSNQKELRETIGELHRQLRNHGDSCDSATTDSDGA
jgi:hypothetical protein